MKEVKVVVTVPVEIVCRAWDVESAKKEALRKSVRESNLPVAKGYKGMVLSTEEL